jgi:hypothetical protein
MKNSNRFLRTLCRVVMVTLLFTQAAFATQPCVTPGMTAASAMSGQMSDDCEMPAASADNLCVMKCADSDKLSAYTSLVVPAPPTGAILVLPPWPDNALAAVAMRSPLEPGRDPPKAIRFCSFLI